MLRVVSVLINLWQPVGYLILGLVWDEVLSEEDKE